jgi:hypothetical protein
MEKIGGSINDIIVLVIFIYLALVLHGVVNAPNEKLQIKAQEFRLKKLPYVLVWAGIVCFSILTINWFL